MGKAFAGYKDKVIQLAMHHNATKLIGYSSDDIASRLRTKVEFTGMPDRDFEALTLAIVALLTELNTSYL